MRTSCPDCGATVDVARIRDTLETVPLEVHPDHSSDARRFRLVALRPLEVLEVTGDAVGEFLPDHRFDCPGANAGRR